MYINRGRYEDFWECPRMYFWRYCQNIDSVREVPALRVGAATHTFLEHWHQGKSLDECLQRMKDDFDRTLQDIAYETPLQHDHEDQLKAQTELLCRDYARRYGNPLADKDFQVVGTELQAVAPLPNGHHIVFRIDGLVAKENLLYVGEHKTTRTTSDRYLNSFLFRMQVIIYVYGAESVLQKPLAGAIINILRKPTGRTASDFYRQPVIVTNKHKRGAITSFAQTIDDIQRRDPNDIDQWPQVTKNCPDCPYFSICAYDAEPKEPLYVKRGPDYVEAAASAALAEEQP